MSFFKRDFPPDRAMFQRIYPPLFTRSIKAQDTLIVDVLCSTKLTQRIGGEDIPTQQVQERFCSLDREHLQYVFDCLRRNTTQIFNIRAYLLTSLYNAPVTISSFNRAAVQRDFGL